MLKRQWLIDIRRGQKKSGGDVARAVGISQQMYSLIELGQRHPSVCAAKRIATVLGFDWTRFFEEPSSEDSA